MRTKVALLTLCLLDTACTTLRRDHDSGSSRMDVESTFRSNSRSWHPRLDTFANPLNLPYRFQPECKVMKYCRKMLSGKQTLRREAADPTMVVYNQTYWLFASKSGGYWHSRDMLSWEFVEPIGLPLEAYAPTVVVVNNVFYYTASLVMGVYACSDPRTGNWTRVAKWSKGFDDPALFQDDNGEMYLLHGLVAYRKESTSIRDVHPSKRWKLGKDSWNGAHADPYNHGWEHYGDNNNGTKLVTGNNNKGPWHYHTIRPAVEGTWMNKHQGHYYLQYAAPCGGHAYGDGVFVGRSMRGPFHRAHSSPACYKPTGYIPGAGHGSTFQDLNGRWWHATTGMILMRHGFERRLSLFPAAFVPGVDGPDEPPALVVDTAFGDYPTRTDGTRPAWHLLSLDSIATASSSMHDLNTKAQYAAFRAVEENIQTWWSAQTGNAGEWLQLDLKHVKTVCAIQVNFADHDALELPKPLVNATPYMYVVEGSQDGATWSTLLDRKSQLSEGVMRASLPHEYAELIDRPRARFVRLTTKGRSPTNAKWSVSGLRLFGRAAAGTQTPVMVRSFVAHRNRQNRRKITIQWQSADRAQFYCVRWGHHKAHDSRTGVPVLHHNYCVYGGVTEAQINSLSKDLSYKFVVDAVNDAGCVPGTIMNVA